MRIWENTKFQEEFLDVMYSATLDEIGRKQIDKDDEMFRRLIETALIFSSSDKNIYRERAYKIAVSVWKLLKQTEREKFKPIYELIFSRLGNFVAIELLNKDIKEKNNSLPLMAWYEKASMELCNTVTIGAEKIIFTNFQSSVWKELQKGTSVSISAPTSAGKSYIIKMYLLKRIINSNKKKFLYIVPTRALISQVSNDLKELLNNYSITNTEVITTSLEQGYTEERNVIYVLTPERVRMLSTSVKKKFNIVIIDEAQSIEDNERGVILQDIIEEIENWDEVQYIFLAPLINNPEGMGKIFDRLNLINIREKESPVFQNIIKAKLTSSKLTMNLVFEEREVKLSEYTLKKEVENNEEKIAILAKKFGKGTSNIIYSTGPAKCETICEHLMMRVGDRGKKELKELADFIKEYVHKEYKLAEYIEHGIAFHYSKLPAIIRKNIEDLFKKEEIRYIVCTNTLLYGVNLPAKNLFIMEPYKDKIPLTNSEFWNLVGRAGRLKEDFNGNIFLINFDEEEEKYLKQKEDISIVPCMVKNVNHNYVQLLKYIEDNNCGANEQMDLENTFLKLFKYYSQGKLNEKLIMLNKISEEEYRLTDEQIQAINNALKNVEQSISLSKETVFKNLSISPYRQEEMFKYILKKIENQRFAEIIPIYPLTEGKETYTNLLRLLKRIHNNFEHKPTADKSHTYFASIGLKWMRGNHISEMIKDHLKKNPGKNVTSAVRSVMDDINNALRFKYVKYISCYIDILIEALKVTGNEELINNIPNIPLFLELGASAQTMINFMELGLSRTTSKVLLDLIKKSNLSMENIREYIINVDTESLKISPICIKEIYDIKKRII